MHTLTAEDWTELFSGCAVTAWHLEMRDVYAVTEEADDFAAWKAGRWTVEQDKTKRHDWLTLMEATRARGIQVLRARIVSTPVSDYIRFEHHGTDLNIKAGEEVRWLPRRQASRIALPGNDFWLFDRSTVVFNHFTGNGAWLGNERSTEAEVLSLCAFAFEDVWDAAIPHADFDLNAS